MAMEHIKYDSDPKIPDINRVSFPDGYAALVKAAIEDAYDKRMCAAYGGVTFGDGGCIQQLLQIQAFVHGIERSLPPFLADIHKKRSAENHEDWQEFQRLKKKFENVEEG
jgi:hypothetical protein